ncbi:MAG: hypothetical protein NC821_05135, partial [Candidatus Omnitrophica bacterium]|nr:hypothetical protein [Candidatus Omnitrophota bacterium]
MQNSKIPEAIPSGCYGTGKMQNENLKFKIIFISAIFLAVLLLPKISWAFDYVMGTTDYGQPNVPQPAQWESYVDPITGVTVRRITDIAKDVPGATNARIEYVRKTPVSSDGRYLLIFVDGVRGNPYYIVDLQTHTLKVAPHITGKPYDNNASYDAQPEYRWDLSGNCPTCIYYRDGMKFYKGDVAYPSSPQDPNYNILLHDFKNEFPTGVIAFNDDEGDASGDSRYWVFMILPPRTPGYLPLAFIVYDKDTDTIIGTYPNPPDRPNFVDMSPSGDRVYVAGNWKNMGGVSFNKDWTDPKQLVLANAHSGWAFDKNGNEGLVQINWSGVTDWLKFVNVKTGEYFTVINLKDLGWGGGHHFGRVYQPHQKGWIFLD